MYVLFVSVYYVQLSGVRFTQFFFLSRRRVKENTRISLHSARYYCITAFWHYPFAHYGRYTYIHTDTHQRHRELPTRVYAILPPYESCTDYRRLIIKTKRHDIFEHTHNKSIFGNF